MARVLIGIPTYNRPQLVREAVGSVLAQSFGDWRLLVSDNATPDRAGERIRAFLDGLGDARIEFHQQDRNLGEYGQGRLFYQRAEALGVDYFVLLHDDDVIDPGYLEAAVAALDARPWAALFVCNPHVMTEDGTRSAALTRDYDRRSQREGRAAGEVDVLTAHMACGFTPISGTVFRFAALRDSGFVDDDLYGCVPFENNIFVRLGERGARGWFEPARLLSFRSHEQQMQKTDYLNNEEYVRLSIVMLERRRFQGVNERRRLQALGRLYRIEALHRASRGDAPGARRRALDALRANPGSLRTCLVAAGSLVAPFLVRSAARSWLDPRPAAAAPQNLGH